MTIIENLGGRKFVFAMFVVLCAFVLFVTGQISCKEFMMILSWSFTIFAAANAVAHLGDDK